MRRHVPLLVLVLLSAAGCAQPAAPSPTPTPAPAPTAATTPPSPPPPAPAPPNPNADPLEGTYALEVSIDSLSGQCTRVPDTIKHLSYSAAIQSTGEAGYTVTLSGGTFLTGSICTLAASQLGCNQFRATGSADAVHFDLNNDDDYHGGHIVAQLPQAGWFELIGGTSGAISNGTISSNGNGSLWYCPTAGLSYPFPCPSYTACTVGALRMNFARR